MESFIDRLQIWWVYPYLALLICLLMVTGREASREGSTVSKWDTLGDGLTGIAAIIFVLAYHFEQISSDLGTVLPVFLIAAILWDLHGLRTHPDQDTVTDSKGSHPFTALLIYLPSYLCGIAAAFRSFRV